MIAALVAVAGNSKSVHFVPPAPHVPWAHAWVLLLALPFGAVLLWSNHRLNAKTQKSGGDGKVMGIVGRMGSGKSYMACRIALKRLKHGANVITNFSMNLDDAPAINALRLAGKRPSAVSKTLGIPIKKVRVLWGVTGEWSQFRGWEQFAEFDDAVVIIDEAHLYAPSNKTLVFPDVARFKMSQARKFRLDVIWLTQHENRVNTVLRDQTNLIFVCRSWMSGAWFSALGYEPEKLRRHGQHLERIGYRFNLAVAQLYNTLEILAADDHLIDGAMIRATEVATAYNATLRDRCEHEQRSHAKAGSCRRPTCRPAAVPG
jgi:hypothetical protein